jgi:hypothetical protein
MNDDDTNSNDWRRQLSDRIAIWRRQLPDRDALTAVKDIDSRLWGLRNELRSLPRPRRKDLRVPGSLGDAHWPTPADLVEEIESLLLGQLASYSDFLQEMPDRGKPVRFPEPPTEDEIIQWHMEAERKREARRKAAADEIDQLMDATAEQILDGTWRR